MAPTMCPMNLRRSVMNLMTVWHFSSKIDMGSCHDRAQWVSVDNSEVTASSTTLLPTGIDDISGAAAFVPPRSAKSIFSIDSEATRAQSFPSFTSSTKAASSSSSRSSSSSSSSSRSTSGSRSGSRPSGQSTRGSDGEDDYSGAALLVPSMVMVSAVLVTLFLILTRIS